MPSYSPPASRSVGVLMLNSMKLECAALMLIAPGTGALVRMLARTVMSLRTKVPRPTSPPIRPRRSASPYARVTVPTVTPS